MGIGRNRRKTTARTAGFGLALVAAYGLGVCELASAQTFAPARLVALKGEPLCPSNVRESPILVCQLVVHETGTVDDEGSTHCFGELGGDDRRRADALRRNLVRSPFEPARVDGEPVKVYASLRIAFAEINGRCETTVYPNLADEQSQAAAAYFAPQEIFAEGGWMGALPVRLRYKDSGYSGMAFVMSVAVDELGNASDGRIEVNNFAFEDSVESAVEALEKQRFIPAMVDGVVRPSRYFEFIYSRESARRRLR